MKDSTIRILKRLLIGFFWIGVWQFIYLTVERDYIVPSPLHTLKALSELLFLGSFYENVGATMLRVIGGILFSVIIGTVSAVGAYFFPLLRSLLSGIMVTLKSVPVMSVILFAILWLTTDSVPVFVCFLICYPVVYTNLLSGLDDMNREYREMCEVYQVGLLLKIRYLYLPSISSHFKAAMSLIAGLSWKTVVASEIFAVPAHSMGYHLLEAKMYLEADKLFAWTIAIVVLSYFFERIVKEALKWL